MLFLLPFLAFSVVINMALGLYYNIGTKKLKFEWSKFFDGLIKAGIIGGSAFGLAMIFDFVVSYVDFGSIEIKPDDLIKAAIVLYVGKAIINLKSILIKE